MIRKKVVFLIPDLSLGGAQRQCLELASALRRYSSYEVIIITFRQSGEMLHLVNSHHFEIHNLGLQSGFDIRNSIRLRKYLVENGISFLVTWLHSADVIGFIATRFTRVKWIVNERDSSYPLKIRYITRIICCAFASSIIANSLQGVSYWKSKYFWKKVSLLNNIVETQNFGTGTIGYDVVFGGRFTAQKRVLETAVILKSLVRTNPHLRVAMIGDGEHFNRVRDLLHDYIGSENVHLMGYSIKFREILSSSKTLINLSSHEGSPNVVLEGLAQGVVPILSDIPEHVAIVGRDYPFLISDITKIDEVVQRVLLALSEDDKRFMEKSKEFLWSCQPNLVVASLIKVIEEEVS